MIIKRMERQHAEWSKQVVPTLSGVVLVSGLTLAIATWCVLYPREPRYDGRKLSYWMAHWYTGRSDRGRAIVNPDTREAVLQAGTNAIPFLLNGRRRPARSTADIQFRSSVLRAFEILGPTAKPAIPDLIAMLGQGGNYPQWALAYIGPDAIPALTNVLSTADRVSVQENALAALGFMGTNAEPALPALIDRLCSTGGRLQGVAAGVAAQAGRNRPDITVPALLSALANNRTSERGYVAEALGVFGRHAEAALPALEQAGQDADPYVRIHAAAASVRISPSTPNALVPLIGCLTNGSVPIRDRAHHTLLTLGTNAAPALPVLVQASFLDPVPGVRITAMGCVRQIDQSPDWVVNAVSNNVVHPNHFVADAAVSTLAEFAKRSRPAFVALLKAMSRNPAVREQASTNLELLAYENEAFLIQCLEHEDKTVRYHAIQVLYRTQIAVPEAVPPLIKALRDEDAGIRRAATNTLIQVDHRAAKAEGIQLPEPWSLLD